MSITALSTDLRGYQRALFLLLSVSPTPLTLADLKRAWGEYVPEDSTVRLTLHELRKKLRPAGSDIVATDAGYSIR